MTLRERRNAARETVERRSARLHILTRLRQSSRIDPASEYWHRPIALYRELYGTQQAMGASGSNQREEVWITSIEADSDDVDSLISDDWFPNTESESDDDALVAAYEGIHYQDPVNRIAKQAKRTEAQSRHRGSGKLAETYKPEAERKKELRQEREEAGVYVPRNTSSTEKRLKRIFKDAADGNTYALALSYPWVWTSGGRDRPHDAHTRGQCAPSGDQSTHSPTVPVDAHA